MDANRGRTTCVQPPPDQKFKSDGGGGAGGGGRGFKGSFEELSAVRGFRRGGLNGGTHQCEGKAKNEPSAAPKGMPPDFGENAPALSGSPNQTSKNCHRRHCFERGGGVVKCP